jgi:hypothetical protein
VCRVPSLQVFSDYFGIPVFDDSRRASAIFQDYSALPQGFDTGRRLKPGEGERCGLQGRALMIRVMSDGEILAAAVIPLSCLRLERRPHGNLMPWAGCLWPAGDSYIAADDNFSARRQSTSLALDDN